MEYWVNSIKFVGIVLAQQLLDRAVNIDIVSTIKWCNSLFTSAQVTGFGL